MKITKMQVAIIAAILVLIAVIIMNRPHKTPVAVKPALEQAQEMEQSVGKYELPPATESNGRSNQDTVSATNTKKQEDALKSGAEKAAIEAAASSDSGSEQLKPGKYPTADQSRQMKEKGIVLF